MRKLRRKFKRPMSPWDMQRITKEKQLIQAFGLKRKKEIRMAEALLRRFRQRARGLIALRNTEEEAELLKKLQTLGMLKEGSGLDDVLALAVEDVLNRRLQTVVFKRGGVLSVKHARQVIVHEGVVIGDRTVKFPSYLVKQEEEGMITLLKTFEPAKPSIKGHVKKPEGAAEETASAEVAE